MSFIGLSFSSVMAETFLSYVSFAGSPSTTLTLLLCYAAFTLMSVGRFRAVYVRQCTSLNKVSAVGTQSTVLFRSTVPRNGTFSSTLAVTRAYSRQLLRRLGFFQPKSSRRPARRCAPCQARQMVAATFLTTLSTAKRVTKLINIANALGNRFRGSKLRRVHFVHSSQVSSSRNVVVAASANLVDMRVKHCVPEDPPLALVQQLSLELSFEAQRQEAEIDALRVALAHHRSIYTKVIAERDALEASLAEDDAFSASPSVLAALQEQVDELSRLVNDHGPSPNDQAAEDLSVPHDTLSVALSVSDPDGMELSERSEEHRRVVALLQEELKTASCIEGQLQDTIDVQKSWMSTLEADLVFATEDLVTSRNSLATLTVQVDAASTSADELQGGACDSERKYDRLQNLHDRYLVERREEIQALEKTIAVAREEAAATKTDITMQALAHRSTIFEASERLAAVSDKVVDQHDQLHADVVSAEEDLKNIQQALADERALNDVALQDFTMLRASHDSLAARHSQVVRDLEECSGTLHAREEELKKVELHGSQGDAKLPRLLSATKQLKADLDLAWEETTSLRQQLDAAQSNASDHEELQALRQQLAAEQCSSQLATARCLALKRRCEHQATQVKSQESSMDDMRIQLQDYEYNNLQLAFEHEARRKVLRVLHGETQDAATCVQWYWDTYHVRAEVEIPERVKMKQPFLHLPSSLQHAASPDRVGASVVMKKRRKVAEPIVREVFKRVREAKFAALLDS
ncbi:hypothetical protein EIP91_001769 [Steccherinum ochraceum]|uniref:Uncharacterized protein n=1 Tax=Steccherinum ochraceum TaxID=92696 RepID=A0A4V2MWG4_9APHY|nr:hypothetical protein EIP91_001769 [Steccherinum ochraceum]